VVVGVGVPLLGDIALAVGVLEDLEQEQGFLSVLVQVIPLLLVLEGLQQLLALIKEILVVIQFFPQLLLLEEEVVLEAPLVRLLYKVHLEGLVEDLLLVPPQALEIPPILPLLKVIMEVMAHLEAPNLEEGVVVAHLL
jgi:hypothetical protein